MFYFADWEPMLSLDDTSLAALFKAAIRYGLTGEIAEFQGFSAVLWGMIAPKIDRDGERYEARRESGEYAVYCREAKRAEGEPMPFDVWKKSRDRSIADDNGFIQQQPHFQNQIQTHFHPQQQGDTRGEMDTANPFLQKLALEDDFEKRREDALRLLEGRIGKIS